jgi:hypothetical protein
MGAQLSEASEPCVEIEAQRAGIDQARNLCSVDLRAVEAPVQLVAVGVGSDVSAELLLLAPVSEVDVVEVLLQRVDGRTRALAASTVVDSTEAPAPRAEKKEGTADAQSHESGRTPNRD